MFINQHESNPQLCDKRASSKFFRAPFERRSVRDCDDEQVPVEHFLHGHQLADRFPQPRVFRISLPTRYGSTLALCDNAPVSYSNSHIAFTGF